MVQGIYPESRKSRYQSISVDSPEIMHFAVNKEYRDLVGVDSPSLRLSVDINFCQKSSSRHF